MCQTIGAPCPNTRSSGELHFLAIFRRPTFKFSLFTLKIRIFKEPWFGRRHSVFISALGFVHYHPIGQAPTFIPAVSALNGSHRSGGTKRRGFRAHCGPRKRHDIWRRITRLEIVSWDAWDGGVATGPSSTLRNYLTELNPHFAEQFYLYMDAASSRCHPFHPKAWLYRRMDITNNPWRALTPISLGVYSSALAGTRRSRARSAWWEAFNEPGRLSKTAKDLPRHPSSCSLEVLQENMRSNFGTFCIWARGARRAT